MSGFIGNKTSRFLDLFLHSALCDVLFGWNIWEIFKKIWPYTNIELAEKFMQIFPLHLMEKLKQSFFSQPNI